MGMAFEAADYKLALLRRPRLSDGWSEWKTLLDTFRYGKSAVAERQRHRLGD